jgi:Flp pilus assembly pilin Flp
MKRVVKEKYLKAIALLQTGAKNLLTGQKGATLIEIALYAALVVIVCIAVIASLGDRLQGVFNTIVNSL